jgi:predicted secreted hydrolase
MSTLELDDRQQQVTRDGQSVVISLQRVAMSPAAALTAYLHQVRRRVGEMWTAPSQTPPALVQIPRFDQLVAAAGKLDSASPDTAAYIASVVTTLLGRATAVDCENPPPTSPVFPADHRLHLSMGAEWYWVGAHLDVVNRADPTDTGRIAVLYSIQRRRAVGVTVQALAGWNDTDAQLASAVGTVTVVTSKQTAYVRRRPNIQWTAAGGSAKFSAANEPLHFQCGSDFIKGSVDVLPLKVHVDDGEMKLDLTLSNPRMAPRDAFFLQGGSPVPGVTPLATPGIYYSWPQVDVAGTIGVGGQTYKVTGGSGWIDHQLMATSLENSGNAATPVPFVDDPRPMNGWSWQYFNLKNGDAFTLASFQTGELNPLPAVFYGFYVTPSSNGKKRVRGRKWTASHLAGVMALEDFQTFDVDAGGGPPSQSPGTVSIPTSWSYLLGSVGDGPVKVALIAQTRKWSDDGTFNNANGGIASELPVDLVDLSVGAPGGGGFGSGVGFGESISFEPVAQYHARALAYLASV